MNITFRLQPRRAVRALFCLALILSLLSVADDVWLRLGGPGAWTLRSLLQSESGESLARWYSSLLFCMAAAGAIAVAQRASTKRPWVGLAVIFLVLSAAKVTSFKSIVLRLGGTALRSLGLEIPRAVAAAVVLLVLVLAYLPFLRSLERRTRRGLLLAGGVYLAGVVVLDISGSMIWYFMGRDSILYALSSALEELVEASGAILLLRALLGHLGLESTERTTP